MYRSYIALSPTRNLSTIAVIYAYSKYNLSLSPGTHLRLRDDMTCQVRIKTILP